MSSRSAFQVNSNDRLSSRICHFCISFLNSWTTFRTRSLSAQQKQKSWLATQLKRQLEGGAVQNEDSNSDAHAAKDADTDYNYLPQYHRRTGNHAKATADDDDAGPVTVNMELDPASFLGAADDDDDEEEEDDDGLEEGEFVERNHSNPQILNALGLRNVNAAVNPMSMLATDMLSQDGDDDDLGSQSGGSMPPSQCRVCQMSFSNRANARRHEKNIHGLRSTDSDGGGTGGVPTPKASPSIMAGALKTALTAVQAQSSTGSNSNHNNSSASSSRRSVASEREVFDYSKPEKYRHLLTDSRMAFIRRNARFLHQYQDMTCRCCDRQYFTYKTFMSHMRKKYTTLPRNVCYSCLRKFETKGQFIAHLKKRNCVNLFTVFMADATIPKDAKLMSAVGGVQGGAFGGSAPGAGEQRIGLKDLLSNKWYGCQVCQEQFRLKNDFRAHVISAHPDLQSCRDPVTGNCRHCQASFTDKLERKRHFSGMDCLVVIICSTCDNQFATHAKFLDHVYGTHLKELNAADQRAAQQNSERLALEGQLKREEGLQQSQNSNSSGGGGQNNNHHHHQQLLKKNAGCVCPICDKQYNNYYNVLWHFESKHPEHVPATYRCDVCDAQFTKQALLKSHVQTEHAELLLANNNHKSGAAGDAATAPVVHLSAQGAFKCRHCDQVLSRAADYIDHQVDEHPDEELLACHECEFVTEERERLQEHLRAQHLNLKVNRASSSVTCSVCKQQFGTESALKCHAMLQHAENESSEQQFKRMLRAAKFEVRPRPGQIKLEEDDEDRSDDDCDDDDLLQDTSGLAAKVKEEEASRVRECPICVEKFPVLADFVVHMQRHVDQDNVTNLDVEPGKSKSGGYHSRMRCRMCQKRISSKVGYRRHLLEEHSIDDCEFVRCDLCPGEFSNEKGLKVHLYRTHNICVKEDGEVVTMGPPGADNHNGVPFASVTTTEYECQICHTVYRSLSLLRSHVQSVHQMHDWDAYIQQYGSGEVQVGADQSQLDAIGLMMMSSALGAATAADNEDSGVTDYTPIEVYFQCRYCDENFASRQKLTAHMNTHEEHDPTDYTCKECGNVYQSRKSLWVHRNKKHPKSQVPSPCEICKKVFFDKTELVYHLKTHVAQKLELMSEFMANGGAGAGHRGALGLNAGNVDGDDDDDDEDGDEAEEGEDVESGDEANKSAVNGSVRKYDCHVCNRKFRDPAKLSQHLRIHEMQNNMFVLGAFAEAGMEEDTPGVAPTTGNGDSADLFEPQLSEDGTEVFACDMCPKRFPQLMALRVHRGWHYRSPDGRQITEPGQTWQPGSLRSQRGNRNRGGAAAAAAAAAAATAKAAGAEKEATVNNNNNNIIQANNNSNHSSNSSFSANLRLPKCSYCQSTFASANNLRRHIVEVHKRNDWRASSGSTGGGGAAASGGGAAPAKSSSGRSASVGGGGSGAVGKGGFVDKERECRACNKKFETRAEWVEHKIGHARVMRPSTTFEWNCEMCGKSFTRKERLLQHMASHASTDGMGGVSGGARSENNSENSRETINDDDEDEDEDEDEDDEGEAMIVNPDVEMLGDDDDDDEEEEGEDGDGDDEDPDELERRVKVEVAAAEEKEAVAAADVKPKEKKKDKSLCCDLCQVSFTDEKELRRHVMSHFVNGGDAVGGGAAAAAAVKAQKEDEPPKAKKAKMDIPQVHEEEEEEDEAQEESLQLNGDDEDLDEGEYIEEYIDEDSFASPKKAVVSTVPTVAATALSLAKAHQPQQQQCRLCSTGYENSFKMLKCMESHRQRSKYQCQECLLFFATPKQLGGHQQLNHGAATTGAGTGVVA